MTTDLTPPARDGAACITAGFAVAGLHHWPDAPARRAYLSHPHRHLFAVKVLANVDHDERAVEFHDLAEDAEARFRLMGRRYHAETSLLDFGARSCEAMARHIGGALTVQGYDIVSVSVSEDGENAAIWVATE